MSKQVLIEYFSFTPSPRSLNEVKLSPSKNLIVEGVVQRAEAKNQNGRIYRKDTLEREVEKYVAGPIAENRALGELDHPDSSIINLKNVCHNIKRLWWRKFTPSRHSQNSSTMHGILSEKLLRPMESNNNHNH